MDFNECVDALSGAYPEATRHLEVIRRARVTAEQTALDAFFEPVSVLDLSQSPSRLISFGPEILLAWIRHVSHATHVRLHSFEPGILSELCAQRLLPAMVLIRSHLEASAFACLAERSLVESAASGDPAPLQTLIPKMLLGTSMRSAAKHDKNIESLLTMGEQMTITIKQAMIAMENLVRDLSAADGNTGVRQTYSFLCEFTHPNPRGIRGFSKVLEQSDDGWVIEYSRTEEFESAHVNMALEVLARSARVGYFTAELLRHFDIEVTDDGFQPIPPGDDELRRIWVEILQGADSD